MAGLLSALGGTLSGIGQGMVKQEEQRAKLGMEMREARRRELERREDKAFQTAEREAGQGFQAGQAEAARGAQASLQTQRLTAEQEEGKLQRQSAMDVAKVNQAGRSSSRYQPLPNPTEDGFLQYFDRETGETLVSTHKMGARPGTEKAEAPHADLYAKAAKIVDERDEFGRLTPEQRSRQIEAEITAMRGPAAAPSTPLPPAAAPSAAAPTATTPSAPAAAAPMAGVGSAAPQPQPTPQRIRIGDVRAGWRYKGGPVNSASSWEPAQ